MERLGDRNEPFSTSYKNLGEFCNLISQQIRDEAPPLKGFLTSSNSNSWV